MRFSIVVPNYNSSKYIKKLIESVHNQTFTDYELIIVDDMSEDNSVDLIKPLLGKKRLKKAKWRNS